MMRLRHRIEATPTEARQRSSRGLTHSLDATKEGLAMEPTQICCYPPCQEAATCDHFCPQHFAYWRYGSAVIGMFQDTEVTRRLVVAEIGECWEWGGSRTSLGYGRVRLSAAHRIAVVLDGRDPEGMLVLHQCDNPPCVNPQHLTIGDQFDNMRDMAARGRGGMKGRYGPDHPKTILTDDQVAEIRSRYTGKRGELAALSREFGISANHVSWIIKGKRRGVTA